MNRRGFLGCLGGLIGALTLGADETPKPIICRSAPEPTSHVIFEAPECYSLEVGWLSKVDGLLHMRYRIVGPKEPLMCYDSFTLQVGYRGRTIIMPIFSNDIWMRTISDTNFIIRFGC